MDAVFWMAAWALMVSTALIILFPWGWWCLVGLLSSLGGSWVYRLHVLVRARREIRRAREGIPARYLVATGEGVAQHRGLATFAVLFPPERDGAAWGAVEMAAATGGAPLAGEMKLVCEPAGSSSRSWARPVVVPVLTTGPLWPTSSLCDVDLVNGQLLVGGRRLQPADRDTDQVEGASVEATPTAGPAEPSPSWWSRAGAVVDDTFSLLEPDVVQSAPRWIAALRGLVLAGSIIYALTVPRPAGAAWIALVVGMFAVRAVAQAATGASPGQRVRGLKVVGAERRRPSWGACALRNAVAAVLVASVVGIPLVLLPATRRPDGRGLHDLLAGTRVVRATPMPDASLGPERRNGRAGATSTAPAGPGVDCPEGSSG